MREDGRLQCEDTRGPGEEHNAQYEHATAEGCEQSCGEQDSNQRKAGQVNPAVVLRFHGPGEVCAHEDDHSRRDASSTYLVSRETSREYDREEHACSKVQVLDQAQGESEKPEIRWTHRRGEVHAAHDEKARHRPTPIAQ
jgi:hypothetical protein